MSSILTKTKAPQGLADITDRLKRIETRMIRGFESIGVDTYDSKEWLSVDEPSHTIYVATMGRALQVINDCAKNQGATVGKVYEIVWRGDVKGTIEIY